MTAYADTISRPARTLTESEQRPDRQRIAWLECHVNFPYNALKVLMFPMGRSRGRSRSNPKAARRHDADSIPSPIRRSACRHNDRIEEFVAHMRP
jgi:hypothetical protein